MGGAMNIARQAATTPAFPSFADPKSFPKEISHEQHHHEELSRGKTVKIIVVDDEPVIADTVAEILNGSGFDATAVTDGKSAVELANTVRPDVLSDVIMPGLNGIETGIKIREIVPACKIILFFRASGHDGDDRKSAPGRTSVRNTGEADQPGSLDRSNSRDCWKAFLRVERGELGGSHGVGAEERAASENALDGQHQIASRLRFQHVALRAGIANFGGQAIRIVHGEYQHARRQIHILHALRQFQTAGAWHGDIEDYDIWLEALRRNQRVVGIGCLTANEPFCARAAQKRADTFADDFMIVDNQNLRFRDLIL